VLSLTLQNFSPRDFIGTSKDEMAACSLSDEVSDSLSHNPNPSNTRADFRLCDLFATQDARSIVMRAQECIDSAHLCCPLTAIKTTSYSGGDGVAVGSAVGDAMCSAVGGGEGRGDRHQVDTHQDQKQRNITTDTNTTTNNNNTNRSITTNTFVFFTHPTPKEQNQQERSEQEGPVQAREALALTRSAADALQSASTLEPLLAEHPGMA
jgi:hypothetical protein